MGVTSQPLLLLNRLSQPWGCSQWLRTLFWKLSEENAMATRVTGFHKDEPSEPSPRPALLCSARAAAPWPPFSRRHLNTLSRALL